MLYIKMLPADPTQGRTTKTFTIANPDPAVGGDVVFVAGDKEWSKVSDEFGEVLRNTVQNFNRANSPALFMVCSEPEADEFDRQESTRRATRGRKVRPRRSLARDLTKPDGGESVADRMSRPADESEQDLTEVELLQAEMDELRAQMAAMVKAATLGPAPSIPTAPPAIVYDDVDKARADALGLTDDDDEGATTLDLGPTPIPEPVETHSDVTAIKGIGKRSAESLAVAEIFSVEDLAAADVDDVASFLEDSDHEISLKTLTSWQAAAREFVE